MKERSIEGKTQQREDAPQGRRSRGKKDPVNGGPSEGKTQRREDPVERREE